MLRIAVRGKEGEGEGCKIWPNYQFLNDPYYISVQWEFEYQNSFFNVMASGGLYFFYLHHSLLSLLIIFVYWKTTL